MAYDAQNNGVLFKNIKKEKPNHPDYTGNITVSGIQKSISAWLKKDKNGNDYLSIAVTDPYVKKESF